MVSSPAGCGQSWFVVLADCAGASAAADMLCPPGGRVIVHASGRPWLVGEWAERELAVAEAGTTRLAVSGTCSVSVTRLAELAARVRDVTDLNRIEAGLAGSFHLLASVDGRVRAQGSASGLRRLFSFRVCGTVVAADRADILAKISGATLDARLLALRLMEPMVPHPLAQRCVWRETTAVPAGSYLHLASDGSARVVRWWEPPEPELPLAEAARGLCTALTAAVAARTTAGGIISADLSGGLDSTPLCFLAAQGPARLIAITKVGLDPSHDDLAWARQAAGHLQGVEHLTFHPDELPDRHEKLAETAGRFDEPELGGRIHAQLLHLARLLAGRGSQVHLSGEGGDHVLQAAPSYLHATIRSHSWTAVRHLRGQRAQRRWKLGATVRGLVDGRSYGAWLADTATNLDPPLIHDRVPALGWQMRPSLPPWASPSAFDAVRDLLREAARDAQSLAPTHGQHDALLAVRGGGRVMRQLARSTAAAGLPWELPFFDDRVVEAALAARLHERTTPFAYKPLMVAAMRGTVPDELLARRTKGEFSADTNAGLRAQRGRVAALLEDPILARLGIVDADALRTAALSMYPPRLPRVALEATLALESWLRAREDATYVPTSGRSR